MKKLAITGVAFAMPFFAFAQTTAFSLLGTLADIINVIIPILIALILIFFIWQALLYVFKSEDKEKYKQGLINGIIALFVVLSVWGIIGVVQKTLGIGAGGTVDETLIPGVQL